MRLPFRSECLGSGADFGPDFTQTGHAAPRVDKPGRPVVESRSGSGSRSLRLFVTVSLAMSDDFEKIRAALAAREEACWERIEDALSELVEVHGVTSDEIRSRVDDSLTRI